MTTERRGVGHIKTMSALVDARRTRTAASAYLELSALSYERRLLEQELDRWKRRHAEILKRMAEIEAKERMLHGVTGTDAAARPAPDRPDELFGREVIAREFDY